MFAESMPHRHGRECVPASALGPLVSGRDVPNAPGRNGERYAEHFQSL